MNFVARMMYESLNEGKMTKEEAYKKLKNVFPNAASFGNLKDFVDGLEAVGLLKFEEEKSIPSPSSIIADVTRNSFIDGQYYLFADKCVNALMQAGYKIVHTNGVTK